MNIYGKLQKSRVELQKKSLKKSGENKFAKFKYYELADFIPTVNEIFGANGLSSNFSINADNMAILIIVDSEATEAQTIEFTSPTAEASVKGCTPIQSLGAIHTYMKRYLYLNALEIVEGDCLDPNVGSGNIETGEKNPDIDLLSGLEALDTVEDLEAYYKKYQSKVGDKMGFIKALKAKKETLIKEGAKNANN